LGYEVAESSDSLGVLAQCPKGSIDLLVLDHDMPNGEGRVIARVIRNETDVPVVFLSGHDREEFRSIVSELQDATAQPVSSHSATRWHQQA
jgi:CheY-like chemotaxis protein